MKISESKLHIEQDGIKDVLELHIPAFVVQTGLNCWEIIPFWGGEKWIWDEPINGCTILIKLHDAV